ncbi:MAG: hypothetical protein JNJ69_13395 [Leptospiraceae bacterium]|nr:hypothetical protein [Leptospiraceae bacterium]
MIGRFGLLVMAGLLTACAAGGGGSDKAKQIEINDNGVTVGSGEPVIVGEGVAYQNVSVPQDFSLKMPVIAQGSGNTIDLGRCYMDFAPSATNLDAHTRRLCGLQFTQVTLELRALFLDLALPDIRAYCHNRLAGCDLSAQEFTITISEPVMRRVQKLFSFYQYTGLEAYFQYNGYEIRNGAKIPFRIDRYEEAPCGQYDYRAVIRTRVIGTYAGEAQVRDNAGDVIILWDRQRQNITMDFRTSVELFGFQINLRRTYDYSDRSTGVRYTSSVNYWTNANPGFSALVHGNSMAAESCSNANTTCTKFRHIASEFIGDDGDLNGLGAAEAYYDALRFSEGVIDANGGIVDSYLSVAGSRNRERVVFRGISTVDYLYQSSSGNPLVLTYGDALSAAANGYVQQYARPGRLSINMTANLMSVSGLESRSLNWIAASDAKEVTQIAGYAVGGSGESFALRWGNGKHHAGRFAYSGTQQYSTVAETAEVTHPLY